MVSGTGGKFAAPSLSFLDNATAANATVESPARRPTHHDEEPAGGEIYFGTNATAGNATFRLEGPRSGRDTSFGTQIYFEFLAQIVRADLDGPRHDRE